MLTLTVLAKTFKFLLFSRLTCATNSFSNSNVLLLNKNQYFLFKMKSTPKLFINAISALNHSSSSFFFEYNSLFENFGCKTDRYSSDIQF